MKTQNTIKFYIYPDGIADSMGQDEFILVRNAFGSVDTKFVGDLVDGDYYCEKIPAPLPPRNADDILRYIAENEITFNYFKDETKNTIMVEALKNGAIVCQLAYEEPKTVIRELIEPIMDMEEL